MHWWVLLASLATIQLTFLAPHFAMIITAPSLMDGAYVGLTVSMVLVTAIPTKLFFGALIMRRHIKLEWALIVSIVSTILITTSYTLAENIAMMLLVRAAHGVVFGTVMTLMDVFVKRLVPPEKLNWGVAVNSSILPLAYATFGTFVLDWVEAPTKMYLTCTLIVVLGLVVIPFIYQHLKKARTSPGVKATSILSWRAYLIPVALQNGPLMGCAMLAYGAIIAFAPQHATEHAFSVSAFVWTLVGSSIMSRFITSPFMSTRSVTILGYASMTTGIVLLTQRTETSFLLATAWVGFGYGAVINTLITTTLGKVSQEQTGLASATLFFFFDSGQLLSGLIGGALGEAFGYSQMWWGFLPCTTLAPAYLLWRLKAKAA